MEEISASVGLSVVGEAVVGSCVIALVGTSVGGETCVGALVGITVDAGTPVGALVGTSVGGGTAVDAMVGLNVVSGPEAGHQAPLQAWQFALLWAHQWRSLWAVASHQGLRKGAQPHWLM